VFDDEKNRISVLPTHQARHVFRMTVSFSWLAPFVPIAGTSIPAFVTGVNQIVGS
jgi:hypothetical protein